MDGVRKPVGDRPPAVYWRRRLSLVAIVVVFAVVVFFLIEATLASDGEEPAPTSSPLPTTTEELAAVAACTDEDISITASPSALAFGGEELPTIDLIVNHTGVAPCRLDTSADGTELLVTSGSVRVYSSLDCQDTGAIPTHEWILAEGAQQDLQVEWSRQWSQEGCVELDQEPGAGFYWAAVSIQGVSAEAIQFELTD